MRDSLDLPGMILMGKAYNRMFRNAFVQALGLAMVVMTVMLGVCLVLQYQWIDNPSLTNNPQADRVGLLNFLSLIGAFVPFLLFIRLSMTSVCRIQTDHIQVARKILAQLLPGLPGGEPAAQGKPATSPLLFLVILLPLVLVVFMLRDPFREHIGTVIVFFAGIASIGAVVYWLYRRRSAAGKENEGAPKIPVNPTLYVKWAVIGGLLLIAPIAIILGWNIIIVINLILFAIFAVNMFFSGYSGSSIEHHVFTTKVASCDYQGALDFINTLEQEEQKQANIMILKGLVLQTMGRDVDAEQVFYRTLIATKTQAAPTIAIAVLDYGITMINQKRFDEGLPFVEGAVRLMPGAAWGYRGMVAYYIEREIEPVRALEMSRVMMAFTQEPRLSARFNRVDWAITVSVHAYVLAWNGEHEEANQLITQALAAVDESFKPWRAAVHNHAGMIARLQDKTSEAQSHFEKAAALDPNGAAGQEARQKLEVLAAE